MKQILKLEERISEAILQLGPSGTLHHLQQIELACTRVRKKYDCPIVPSFDSEIRSTLQAFSWDDKQRKGDNPKLFIHGDRGYWGHKVEPLSELLK